MQRAFTLWECLIVLALISLLSALSLPSFFAFLQKSRDEVTWQHFLHLLESAKNRAIQENVYVIICPFEKTSAYQCVDTWQPPFGMWVSETPILTSSFFESPSSRFEGPFFEQPLSFQAYSQGHNHYLQFTPLGLTHEQNGTFSRCVQKGEDTIIEKIIVNQGGRLYREKKEKGSSVC